MRSQGLKWPLDDLVWGRGDVGVSNEIIAENMRVNVSSGALLAVTDLMGSW
jgi:thiamine pyrophosphokinase